MLTVIAPAAAFTVAVSAALLRPREALPPTLALRPPPPPML